MSQICHLLSSFPGSLKSHNPPHCLSPSHHSTLAAPRPKLTSSPHPAVQLLHLSICSLALVTALLCPRYLQSSRPTQKHHSSSCPHGTVESMALMGHVAEPSPMKLFLAPLSQVIICHLRCDPLTLKPAVPCFYLPENTVHLASRERALIFCVISHLCS